MCKPIATYQNCSTQSRHGNLRIREPSAGQFRSSCRRVRCYQGCLFGLLAFIAADCAFSGDTAGISGPSFLLWAIGRDPIGVIQGLGSIPDMERRRELYRKAIKRCDAETKLLPDAFDISAVVDEGASLRSTLIYELLVRRGVRAIYVRPVLGPLRGDGTTPLLRYGLPDGQGVGDWVYSPTKLQSPTYIKLELANRESGLCDKSTEFSRPGDGGNDRYNRPPLLPSTCLAISATDKPDALVALRYLSGKEVNDEEFGRWALVDLVDSRVIASLTTIDVPPQISSEARQGASTDCRSPYTVLAWRIKPKTFREGEFSVEMHDVAPIPALRDLWQQKGSLTTITPTVTRSSEPRSGADKYKLLFGEDLYPIAWSTATAEAVNSGRGHYVHSILNWDTRTLRRLRDDDMRKNYWDIHVRTADGGYFVFDKDWRGSIPKLLARYDLTGKLDWAVNVAATGPDCYAGPLAVEVSPTLIVLRSPPCDGGVAGTNWELRKLDIPFYAAQMKPASESKQADAQPVVAPTLRTKPHKVDKFIR